MGRHQARQGAIQILYALETSEQVSASTALLAKDLQLLNKQDDMFMHVLVEQVKEHQQQYDGLLENYLRNWTISRLNVVDRCILRLAVCELMGGSNAPDRVIINEAVELAQKYSDTHAHEFINGVLGHMVADGVFNNEDIRN